MHVKNIKNMQSNIRFSKYVIMLIFLKDVRAIASKNMEPNFVWI